MMMKRLLWSLFVAHIYSECIFASSPNLTTKIQRNKEYRDLNVSDSRNIHIFRKALKSLGEDPTGITLQSLSVRDLVFRSLYLAQYSKYSVFECTLRFSVGLVTGIRVIAPKCSTVAPPLALTTTVATTSALSSEATLHTTEPNYKVDGNDDSTDTVPPPGNEPELVEGAKKANSSAGIPDTNRVLETYPAKDTNVKDSVASAYFFPENDGPRTSTVTKVPVSANGNFEIGSSKFDMVPKPPKKAPVGDKVSRLCFDESLFLKIDGKWTPSDEGC
uniref:Aspartyl/glutamyl-tRNA(Asn/Gln) amidotransferase subunit B n=1 Tax=Lygus hesperus TaxID=30085 RepID=A0A0A9WVH9_LYGHE